MAEKEEDKKEIEVKSEDFFSSVLSVIGKTTDDQVTEALKESKLTISVAESITGGLISARLTTVPGSSEFFVGGIVCYSNLAKVTEVSVSPGLISKKGAVSKEVAIAMAEGVKKRLKTDIGLAVTGVAGPIPLPPQPVGKVFIALAGENETDWKELNLKGERGEIRDKAAQAALGLLWLYLGGEDIVYKGKKE